MDYYLCSTVPRDKLLAYRTNEMHDEASMSARLRSNVDALELLTQPVPIEDRNRSQDLVLFAPHSSTIGASGVPNTIKNTAKMM